VYHIQRRWGTRSLRKSLMEQKKGVLLTLEGGEKDPEPSGKVTGEKKKISHRGTRRRGSELGAKRFQYPTLEGTGKSTQTVVKEIRRHGDWS